MSDIAAKLQAELDQAERKAWDALARYKFQMFGYWAAIWVHLNHIGGFKKPNPFRPLVGVARGGKVGIAYRSSAPAPLTSAAKDVIGSAHAMSCDEQYAIATAVAANVGYVLHPEPMVSE